MKNSLYIIAGLLLLFWGIVTFGYNSSWVFNLLLPLAGFIVLLRIFYKKKSLKKL